MLNYRTGLVSFLVGTAVLTGCCGASPEKPKTKRPLYLGIGYDVSASAEKQGLPVLTEEHLSRVIKLVETRGGEMAFSVIDEKAFEPLVRLKLLEVDGRLDQRAEIRTKNEEKLRTFQAQIKDTIHSPRDAKHTDINGSIARLRLFFDEPTVPDNADKVALYVTDGIDTGPWRKMSKIQLPPGITVLVIGVETNLARKLFGKNVALFEALNAAIESIQNGRKL